MQTDRLLLFLLFPIAFLGRPLSLPAQGTRADSSAIRRLIQAHADAWNRHDAHAAAAAYAANADVRYSSGERLQGRAQIEAGHRAAFAEDTAGGGSQWHDAGPRAFAERIVLQRSNTSSLKLPGSTVGRG